MWFYVCYSEWILSVMSDVSSSLNCWGEYLINYLWFPTVFDKGLNAMKAWQYLTTKQQWIDDIWFSEILKFSNHLVDSNFYSYSTLTQVKRYFWLNKSKIKWFQPVI